MSSSSIRKLNFPDFHKNFFISNNFHNISMNQQQPLVIYFLTRLRNKTKSNAKCLTYCQVRRWVLFWCLVFTHGCFSRRFKGIPLYLCINKNNLLIERFCFEVKSGEMCSSPVWWHLLELPLYIYIYFKYMVSNIWQFCPIMSDALHLILIHSYPTRPIQV